MMVRYVGLAIVAGATVWTFLPAAGFAFLNWDDHAVILQNTSLEFPGVWQWAFTTTYIEHYQPLSWLVWAAIKAQAGADPRAFHTASIAAHVACALFVFGVARTIAARAQPGASAAWHEGVGMAGALLYALHPLRVEVIAWVSALPYAIALAFALASLLAYMRARLHGRRAWLVAAWLLFALSLLARPLALGAPVVFVAIDRWLFRATWRASLTRVWPFAAAAVASAVVESAARVPALNEAPWLYRLQSFASAPFVYLWHTVAPLALTPLDVLPLEPVGRPVVVMGALAALAGISAAAWTCRAAWPSIATSWIAYLALLAPAAGLVQSGLQATADRYAYVPGVVIALVLVTVGAWWAGAHARRRTAMVVVLAALAVASAAASRRALVPWSDSVSLWTRVVALDPTNDVGLYNLGTALEAAGRRDEAADRYREVLALQPEHGGARANLHRLDAARLEQEGNDLAARGNLAAAADRYSRAIALDPKRTHSQASLGMALAGLGRDSEAVPALREALTQGTPDPAVPNALAALLAQRGQSPEARRVLERALAVHQNDVNLAHNLARLLATTEPVAPEDAAIALRLATAVVQTTGGRDPRALDTLAAAQAASGRRADAAQTSERAAALAAAQGDRELAVQVAARGRAYRREQPRGR
jgi:tetratricopeptide (TPR) repeat protein